MSKEQKNLIRSYHNIANEEDLYGEELVEYLISLEIAEPTISKIYSLSVDWPNEFKMQMAQ